MPVSSSADELFEKGLQFLREENSLAALPCFEKAFIQNKTSRTRSYLGYCIAAQRGQITDGLQLCREAIGSDPDNPEHYLNLARVYLKAKKKDEAIEALRRGLSAGENSDIKALLAVLGLRKKPLIPFLSRSHFLNKYIGLALRRLGLR